MYLLLKRMPNLRKILLVMNKMFQKLLVYHFKVAQLLHHISC